MNQNYCHCFDFGTAPNQTFIMSVVSLLVFLTKLVAELDIRMFNLIILKKIAIYKNAISHIV